MWQYCPWAESQAFRPSPWPNPHLIFYVSFQFIYPLLYVSIISFHPALVLLVHSCHSHYKLNIPPQLLSRLTCFQRQSLSLSYWLRYLFKHFIRTPTISLWMNKWSLFLVSGSFIFHRAFTPGFLQQRVEFLKDCLSFIKAFREGK